MYKCIITYDVLFLGDNITRSLDGMSDGNNSPRLLRYINCSQTESRTRTCSRSALGIGCSTGKENQQHYFFEFMISDRLGLWGEKEGEFDVGNTECYPKDI